MKPDQLVTGITILLLLVSSPEVSWGFPKGSDVFHMEIDPNYPREPLCFVPDENARFDCHPESAGTTQQDCEACGCCWQVPSNAEEQEEERQRLDILNQTTISVPYCYFPANYDGYEMTDLQETTQGYHAILSRTTKSGWPDDVMKLNLDVYMETETRLHFKVRAQSYSSSCAVDYTVSCKLYCIVHSITTLLFVLYRFMMPASLGMKSPWIPNQNHQHTRPTTLTTQSFSNKNHLAFLSTGNQLVLHCKDI